MNKVYLSFILLGFILLHSCSKDFIENIKSPDGLTICNVEADCDSLYLKVSYKNKSVIKKSSLILNVDSSFVSWNIEEISSCYWEDTFSQRIGENSFLKSAANEKIFNLTGKNAKGSKINAKLFVRVFNKTIAYRFIIVKDGTFKVEEKSSIYPASDNSYFYFPNGEYEPIGNKTLADLNKKKKYFTPVVWNDDRQYIKLHEASVHNYPEMKIGVDKKSQFIYLYSGEALFENNAELPWRILSFADDWAELHSSKYISYNLSKPSEGDYSWVKPGLSSWDWRVRGCSFDGFRYELNTESLKRFIDFSSRNGIDYFLIDAHWYEDDNPLLPVKSVDIKEVINYGNNNNVGIWLYYDLGYTKKSGKEVDFEKIAKTYSGWGAKGIKYGFLGAIGTKYTPQGKVSKTEEVIKIAGKYKLMIDFHDNPIPFSGLERTYPNYLSREYCHAQMDRRTAFSPSGFVKMACINLLAGAIDQTNGIYELNKIKERERGPKNDYNSTIASENARVLVTHTGHLTVLIDAPEAYENKSEMFDFIKQLPKCWDESRYLDMDFNSHVTVARRNVDAWFLGTVYNENGGKQKLKLDFLDDNVQYEVTLYKDSPNSHYVNNKEEYEIVKTFVSSKSVLSVDIAPGGGYSAIFRKI